MDLKEIASVSGKGGLYKILKPTKSGVILESLDESKTKLVAAANQRLSLLSEISIYTTDKEGSTPLEGVLKKIHADFGKDLGVDADSDGIELKAFLKAVLPEFDEARVYVSDIKKLVKWYGVLLQYAPEALSGETQVQESKDTTDKAVE